MTPPTTCQPAPDGGCAAHPNAPRLAAGRTVVCGTTHAPLRAMVRGRGVAAQAAATRRRNARQDEQEAFVRAITGGNEYTITYR